MSAARGVALLVLPTLASCFPTPTPLAGKACDETHACGPALFCVEGVCRTEPAVANGGGREVGAAGGGEGGAAGGRAGGAGGGAVEDCTDRDDNDGDGLRDCDDPQCLHKSCDARNTAAICCSTPTESACVDLSSDPLNCGMCGGRCQGGYGCVAVTVGTLTSGRCKCEDVINCPSPVELPGSLPLQTCVNGACACQTAAECGTGQWCTLEKGLTDPGWCHY